MPVYIVEPLKLIDWIKSTERLRDDFIQDQKILMDTIYKCYDSERDARLTIYSKIINALSYLNLSLVYVSEHLSDPEWWKKYYEDITIKDCIFYISNFVNNTKISFYHIVFSCIESSLRILLRAVDTDACNYATAEFKSIYECLLKSKLTGFNEKDILLFDLIRNIRNTIHNNGIFFDKKSRDQVVIWKGKEYCFYHTKPVDFLHYELLFDILNELRIVIKHIVSDREIIRIEYEITDYLPIKLV